MNNNTLILGLGNTLLADEGVGVRTVEQLKAIRTELQNVVYLDGGTLSFTLTAYLEGVTSLIVIDAAQLHSEPGTVCLFEGEDMDRFITQNRKSSVHEVSLLDLFAAMHILGELPQRRALIGIQPGRINWFDALTDSVNRAIPKACEIAANLVQRWQNVASQSRGLTDKTQPPIHRGPHRRHVL